MFEGRRPSRLLRHVSLIKAEVSPRVSAAVYRCVFDGLLAATRFQQRRECIFHCCGEGNFSHYCRCSGFDTSCSRHLQLQRPSPGQEFDYVLLLLPSGSGEEHVRTFCARVVALYALHTLLNSRRHGSCARDPIDAFGQRCHEAVNSFGPSQAPSHRLCPSLSLYQSLAI